MGRWGHFASSLFSISLLREQSLNTSRDHQEEGGPRKEEQESRRAPSTLSTISRLLRTLGRTPQVPAVLHCKYTVEPERFNPQRLIAGINVGGNEVGRRPASGRMIFEVPVIIFVE